MTATTKTTFLCQDCGRTSPKWEGRCPACGAWGTYVEFTEPKASRRGASRASAPRAIEGPAHAAPLHEQPGGDAPPVKLTFETT